MALTRSGSINVVVEQHPGEQACVDVGDEVGDEGAGGLVLDVGEDSGEGGVGVEAGRGRGGGLCCRGKPALR